jgi:hypothetical protein
MVEIGAVEGKHDLCANYQGFSLCAGVHCAADDR